MQSQLSEAVDHARVPEEAVLHLAIIIYPDAGVTVFIDRRREPETEIGSRLFRTCA